MGTIMSGWYRGHAPRCEHRLALDLAGLGPKIAAGGVIWKCWSYQDERHSAFLHIEPAGFRIEYGDAAGRSVASEFAYWRAIPRPFGGSQLFMGCPNCQRRCRALYYGRARLYCRLCLGPRYQSQLTQPGQRLLDRANKIARRLNPSDPNANALDSCPPRLKGMRRRTYHRLEAEFDRYATLGLARVMASLAR
jgi:hypothetical protein